MPDSLPARPRRWLADWGAVTVWGARLAWVAAAVLGGEAVGEALAGRSQAVQVTGTVGAWVGWAVGALALAVAGVVTLTVARAVVPGSLAVAVATFAGGAGATVVLALAVPGLVATLLVGSAETGRRYVEAAAYGDERRFPLRPPIGYLAATVVTWAAWVAAIVAAPLAVAAGAVAAAVPAVLVAAAGAWLLPRRWHQLSRRWFVVVPAGLVVHDPVVLAETVMLPRRAVAAVVAVAPGPRGEQALDLTGPTPGVAVRIDLREATTAVLAPRPDTPRGRAIHLTSLLVAPSRPGAALRETATRRYPT